MTELGVVVGATGALGSAIVARLRRADLRVIAVARSADALAELAAGDADILPVVADLQSDDAVATIAAAVDAPVRIAVQAAGLPASGTIDTITGDEIQAGMNGKIGGFLRLIRGVHDQLGPGSRLVVLGGHYGFEPTPNAPLAGMANAALGNLVRSLSDRYGPDGVTVHLIAPGPVESPRMTAIAQRIADRREGEVTADEVLDEYRAGSPLGRLTTVAEVAWAVELLLDPEASGLHGSTLSLDLGRRRGIG
jgi:NAD(P)-dependent dehydrogenase (short-subunit alcohol dehydrogenase family)